MWPVRRAAFAAVAVLLLAGCGGGGGNPDSGPTSDRRRPSAVWATTPQPDPSALVRAVGQGCAWHGGLAVTVVAVRRDDADTGGKGRAGYSVAVRVVNTTPMGYNTDALRVALWVGPHDQATHADYQSGLGTGLGGAIAAPGKTVTGSYGFQLPLAHAQNQVAVGVRPSPVDQQCLLRGTTQPAATP